MDIGSEPIVARFGRHRMGFSWNCAVNSAGSGSRAQAVERRTQKAKATCHYLCLNRPELIIYANKSLHCRCACEQIAGHIRLEYPQDPDMRIGPETIYRWMYAAAQLGDTSYGHLRRAHRRRRRQTRYGRGRRVFPRRIALGERTAACC